MLRVAEKWQGSDVGRQRHDNEDSFFVQAPLFVVADGMGGAQAGEVASELAVAAFRAGLPAGSALEAMVETIRGANHRIVDMASADAHLRGMGTTCTAAYVAEEEVVLAHVGDSRCYVLRDRELTRLTRDHSLVGELVDRGKLTEEEAEVHPQRSVITRALGAEADVKVDTERIAGRADDVFMLCSDGLTGMVREPDVERLLAGADGLEAAGRSLIAAANAAGGRDNITVVLFRLEEVEVASGGAADGGRTAEHQAVSDPAGAAVQGTAVQGTAALAAVAEPQAPAAAPPPRRIVPLATRAPAEAPAKRGRRHFTSPLIVTAVLLAIFASAAFVAMRGVFFVGLDDHRAVTIYRGLPYVMPAGIKLFTRDYTSGVTLEQVPVARRKTFTAHKLRSLNDAEDLVRQLESGTLRG